MRRKREQTQALNFLSIFSCPNVFVRWFCLHGFAFGVWGSFSELTPKWRPKFFCLSLHLPGWCSTSCFYFVSPSRQLSNPSHPFHTASCRQEEHPFPLIPHRRRRPGTSGFFKSSSTNVVIHTWPTDPQVPWPKSLRCQLLNPPIDSVSAFFLIILSLSLSPSLEISLSFSL